MVTPEFEIPILVWGAGGGHGATTVAGAVGLFLGTTPFGHDLDSMDWMWPGGASNRTALPRVLDAGVLQARSPTPAINVVVIRGPCGLGLRRLARAHSCIDQLILIREPWRPMGTSEVVAALGVKIGVEIPHSPRIARLADAGLLPTRAADLDEFAELKAWAISNWSGNQLDLKSSLRGGLQEAFDGLEDPVYVRRAEESLRPLGRHCGER